MGPKAFIFCVAALAILVLLCAAPFPGALVGFMFGIAVAFFIAPTVFVIAPALQSLGVAITEKGLIYVLVALYGVATFAIFVKAWQAWRRGDPSATRLFEFHGIIFAALPVMGLLSSQALVKAWPH